MIQPFGKLDSATEAALTESIKRFGVIVPVVKDQDGVILDGHHRAKIAKLLGVDYETTICVCRDDSHRMDLARTLNADRRHLTAEQRREVAVALRQAGHSLRAIGGALGVDKETVRKDISASTVESSTVATTPSTATVEVVTEVVIADATLPSTIVGLDGKTRKAGVEPRKAKTKRRTKEELEELRKQIWEMRLAGKSRRQTAKEAGVSVDTVTKYSKGIGKNHGMRKTIAKLPPLEVTRAKAISSIRVGLESLSGLSSGSIDAESLDALVGLRDAMNKLIKSVRGVRHE